MTTEIELKFIVTEQALTALPTFLSQWSCLYEGKQELTNCYYETEDYFLRKHHMGLRIRQFDDQYEMTLKTAGRVIAGLHQRPEYNISLTEAKLQLAQLPHDIWPADCDIALLQSRLKPLFSTDFVREKWLVTYQNSEIELALDRGDIKSNGQTLPLNEIELELKQGELADVLAFALEFSQLDGLRLASKSKAARGYQLAQQLATATIKPFAVLSAPKKATVEDALQLAMETVLSYWQYHEELWIEGNPQGKNAIFEAITLLRQIWIIWGTIIPRKATAKLREQLQHIEQLLLTAESEICYQSGYSQTKLALTQWLLTQQWQYYLDKAEQVELAGSFKRFADVMLSRTAKVMKTAFNQHIEPQQGRDKQQLLTKQLMNILLLAGAYPSDIVGAYMALWQNLLQALAQQNHQEYDRLSTLAINQPLFWLNSATTK